MNRTDHAEEDKRRRKWYDRGWSDDRIAKKRGVARVTITAWRLKNNLPPNRKKGANQLSDAEHKRRLKLWGQGLPDAVIGEEVGVSLGAIMRWRQKLGLERNDFNEWIHTHRVELWENGWTDEEIAEEQNVTPDAIRVWRNQNNLEANR